MASMAQVLNCLISVSLTCMQLELLCRELKKSKLDNEEVSTDILMMKNVLDLNYCCKCGESWSAITIILTNLQFLMLKFRCPAIK